MDPTSTLLFCGIYHFHFQFSNVFDYHNNSVDQTNQTYSVSAAPNDYQKNRLFLEKMHNFELLVLFVCNEIQTGKVLI